MHTKDRWHHRPVGIALACLAAILLFLSCTESARAQAEVPSPQDIIGAVNRFRAGRGLPPLQGNALLMAIAQGQSDYMAVGGGCTHTGPDGSRPRDRAASVGYGSGSNFFISENIMCLPPGVSADQVVQGWADMDELHLNTLIKSQYKEIGAGVTELDGVVYYTLDVAVVAGGVAPKPTTAGSTPGSLAASATPLGVSPWIIPVKVSPPQSDGSIVHEVKSGQTLWAIAIAYKVKIIDLRALNGLPQDSTTIYAGQKLRVRNAVTPTPTRSATQTPAPTLRPTPTRPTSTPAPTFTPTPIPPKPPDVRQWVGWGLLAGSALGLLLVILGNIRK